MVKAAAPPPFTRAFPDEVRIDRPCISCRWKRPSLVGSFARIVAAPEISSRCTHPAVEGGVVGERRFLVPDYVITEPDPVTGRPGSVNVSCILARSNPHTHHHDGDPPPKWLCGPAGRYWEKRA